MSALAPCTACRRHVRVDETTCPFCRSTLALRAIEPRGIAAQRLGRAAIFTFGAVAIGAAPGCSTATTPADDAGTDAYYGSIGDVYGAPAHDAGWDAGTDSGVSAHYGGPPADAALSDANEPDAVGAALYGAPPPPPAPPETP